MYKCNYNIYDKMSCFSLVFLCFYRLTQLDAESLFHKLEMIILEYINEIRNQVLKRFQICLKSSNDGKLFISYFLDEYNTFIQAAKNVSTIISYLVRIGILNIFKQYFISSLRRNII